jgi:hypothetical protein
LYFKEKNSKRDEIRQNNNNSVQKNERQKKFAPKTLVSQPPFFVVVKFMTSFKHIRCCMFYNKGMAFFI